MVAPVGASVKQNSFVVAPVGASVKQSSFVVSPVGASVKQVSGRVSIWVEKCKTVAVVLTYFAFQTNFTKKGGTSFETPPCLFNLLYFSVAALYLQPF